MGVYLTAWEGKLSVCGRVRRELRMGRDRGREVRLGRGKGQWWIIVITKLHVTTVSVPLRNLSGSHLSLSLSAQ